MGNYLNPGNSGFSSIRNDIYVDKSKMIALINETIDTPRRLTCVSRPRRFGKSFAAKMLCAYYDRSCDSSALFEDLEIAKNPGQDDSYQKYLNRYDVIYLDMTAVIGAVGDKTGIVPFVVRNVTKELVKAYPELEIAEAFHDTLANATILAGTKFVMIIDEWDAPIREGKDDLEVQREYLEFLRALFKNSGATDKVFAAAYMTGILPIKKDGSQSAISDFKEYTIANPRNFAEYVGFTEKEVEGLCAGQDAGFSLMKQWYDGYTMGQTSVYNPSSVMEALRNREFASYWTETSASKSLMEYISLDFDGMSKTIAKLLGGIDVSVDINGFANDLVTFRDQDDVLTLLIHLGYLAYDRETKTARIPNEEIRMEFAKSVRKVNRDETVRRVRESDRLIMDTVQENAEAVAAQIEKIHAEETAPLFYVIGNEISYDVEPSGGCAQAQSGTRRYSGRAWRESFASETLYSNNEQSLRGVIKLAYFSYKDYYLKFEELPSGEGHADIVYFPKRNSPMPVLVVELKWNQSAEGAIDQIKEKRYPQALSGYGGDILLVGIAYDKDAKAGERKHACVIERA